MDIIMPAGWEQVTACTAVILKKGGTDPKYREFPQNP
jgi:hypothetical protein